MQDSEFVRPEKRQQFLYVWEHHFFYAIRADVFTIGLSRVGRKDSAGQAAIGHFSLDIDDDQGGPAGIKGRNLHRFHI
jgi:hypothetical protein